MTFQEAEKEKKAETSVGKSLKKADQEYEERRRSA